MRADGDVSLLKYLLGFQAGKCDVLFHIAAQGRTDIDQLVAAALLLRRPFPKYIQVLTHSLPHGLVVFIIRGIAIPFRFAVIGPDVRSQTVTKGRVIRNLLDPDHLRDPEAHLIHHAVRPIQHLHRQNIIISCNKGISEFDPHPQVAAQRAQTGPAYKMRLLNDLAVPEQLAKFLLKKAAHRDIPLDLGFSFWGTVFFGDS